MLLGSICDMGCLWPSLSVGGGHLDSRSLKNWNSILIHKRHWDPEVLLLSAVIYGWGCTKGISWVRKWELTFIKHLKNHSNILKLFVHWNNLDLLSFPLVEKLSMSSRVWQWFSLEMAPKKCQMLESLQKKVTLLWREWEDPFVIGIKVRNKPWK